MDMSAHLGWRADEKEEANLLHPKWSQPVMGNLLHDMHCWFYLYYRARWELIICTQKGINCLRRGRWQYHLCTDHHRSFTTQSYSDTSTFSEIQTPQQTRSAKQVHVYSQLSPHFWVACGHVRFSVLEDEAWIMHPNVLYMNRQLQSLWIRSHSGFAALCNLCTICHTKVWFWCTQHSVHCHSYLEITETVPSKSFMCMVVNANLVIGQTDKYWCCKQTR